MYIEYFLVTFAYCVVPIDGINLTEDVHTDSPYLHDGSITILVLLLHKGLDKCVWDVACCEVSTFLCFDNCNMSVPSVLMVRLITSSCSIYACCVLPFAQCQDYIVLSLFSVKTRSHSIALCLSDLLSEHLMDWPET